MSWFKVALVLHVLGVLVLFGAISLELVSIILFRHARNIGQVGDIGAVMRRVGRMFGPAGGLILLSGVYMTIVRMQRHESIAWVVVSLVLFIMMAASGAISGRKMEESMERVMKASQGRITPELEKLMRRNPSQVNAAFGPWAVAGLVVLMVFKPDVIISVVVLLVAMAVGYVMHRQLFGTVPDRPASVDRPVKV